MEADPITGFIEWLMNFNVTFVLQVLTVSLLALWLVMLWWFWLDSTTRYETPIVQLIMGVIVVFVPIVGLLIYLIMRPRQTLAERYFEDLDHKFLLAEVDSISICEKCGDVSSKRDRYCQVCGNMLKRKCKECGTLLDVKSAFCSRCGTQQPVKTLPNPDIIKKEAWLGQSISTFSMKLKSVGDSTLKKAKSFIGRVYKKVRALGAKKELEANTLKKKK